MERRHLTSKGTAESCSLGGGPQVIWISHDTERNIVEPIMVRERRSACDKLYRLCWAWTKAPLTLCGCPRLAGFVLAANAIAAEIDCRYGLHLSKACLGHVNSVHCWEKWEELWVLQAEDGVLQT